MRTVNPEKWSARMKEKQKVKRRIFGSTTANAFEIRLRSSLRDAVKDFLLNSSNEGLKYMREKNMAPTVRRCYILSMMVFSLLGLLVVLHDWRSYRSKPPLAHRLPCSRHLQRCYILSMMVFSLLGFLVVLHDWRSYRSKPPLVINLHSMQHPVQHIDFPAVAICSYSVISGKALNALRCYILSMMVFSLLGFLVVLHDWRSYRSKPPLVINLHSMQHPVQHIDFPAVAICSYNVISRKALKEYASYLYSLDRNGTYSLEAIEKNLLTFGALQTWSSPPVDVEFMQYLARVAQETNVTNIILKLTPKCSSYLKRCSWRTVRAPCDRLMGLRATPHGFCCVFNSRYSETDVKNPIKKLNFVGEDAGLSMVVKENDSDAAYIRGSDEGVEVLLFDGSEYPSIAGGSSKVYLAQRNVSAFLQLSVQAQYTAPGLQQISENWRGCRIRDASAAIDRRSYSWCLVNCRRTTVQALCGCVPHQLFPQPQDTVCSPDQLSCLNKHKEKFRYFFPGEQAHPSLNEEVADALICEDCRPDCARLRYSAAVSLAHYRASHKLYLNLLLKGMDPVNTSTIRIYYASEDQQMFIVESNLRWFEVVAGLGSRWVCLLAVTTISMVELWYFLTIRWAYHYARRKQLDRVSNKIKLTPSIDE